MTHTKATSQTACEFARGCSLTKADYRAAMWASSRLKLIADMAGRQHKEKDK